MSVAQTALRATNGTRLSGTVGSGQDPQSHLRGRRLVFARALWAVVFFGSISLFLADVPRRFDFVIRLAQSRPSWLQLGYGMDFFAYFFVLFDLFCMFAFGGVAALIFSRRSDDWMGIYVSLALVTYPAIATFFWFVTQDPSVAGNWLLTLLEGLGLGLSLIFYYIFPSGQFIPHWTRPIAAAYIIWCLTWFLYPPLNPTAWPLLISTIAFGGLYLTGVFAQIYRYRRTLNSVQRQQTKWVVFGTAMIALGVIALQLFRNLASPGLTELAQARIELVSIPFIVGFQLFVPVTFGLAILRYRLYDIDIVLNRTLVYVPLTAILAGVYTASVTLSSRMLVASTSPGTEASTALATLIVVIAFSPIKDQLQKLVDRRFKEAPNPETKLAAFARRIRERISPVDPEQIIRRLLEEAIAAFGARGGAALLEPGAQGEPLVSLGEWKGEAALRVSVKDLDKSFASIALAARRDARDYDERDRQILTAVACEVARAIEQDCGKKTAPAPSRSPIMPM